MIELPFAAMVVGLLMGLIVGSWIQSQIDRHVTVASRVAETPDTDPRDT